MEKKLTFLSRSTSGLTVTNLNLKFRFIVLFIAMLTFTNAIAQQTIKEGVWYNLIQNVSGLYLSGGASNPLQAVVKTQDAVDLTQMFQFIPVDPEFQPGTYYIMNAAGKYLNGISWTTTFVEHSGDASTEWTLSGDNFTNARLKVGGSGYIASDAVSSGSFVYCDKSETNGNGSFTLQEAPAFPNPLLSVSKTTLSFSTGNLYKSISLLGIGLTSGITFKATSGITLAGDNLVDNGDGSYTIELTNANSKNSIDISVASEVGLDGSITVATEGVTTQIITCKSGIQANVWYYIYNKPSGLYIGGTTADPTIMALMTADAADLTQKFQFTPVDGADETFNIINGAGKYMQGVGWTTTFVDALNGTNTEWIMSGDYYTNARIKVGSSNYLASDALTSGSPIYCDKSVDNANGSFELQTTQIITGISQVSSNFTVRVSNRTLTVSGVDNYTVYNLQGVIVANVKNNAANTSVSLNQGVYIIRTNGTAQKVLVK